MSPAHEHGPKDGEPRSEAERYEAFINQIYWDEPSDDDDRNEDADENDEK